MFNTLRRIAAARSGVVLTCLIALALGAPGIVAAKERLTVLTWSDYVDPEVIAEFEAATDTKVEFTYFESDDHRDELVTANNGTGFDVAMINGVMLGTYAVRDWLAPVDESVIENIRHLEPRWRDAFPSGRRYGVPYFWGTLGIGYRKDLVPDGFRSWTDFFKPSDRLRGRLTMLKSSRDVLGMALKSLGHSANSDDREAIRAAGRLLEAQRPFVRSYEYVSLGEESALVTGEIWASLMYSGDALMVQEHNDNIAYVVPEEGGNLWVDYLVTMQASPRKDIAARFIDFLNRPEIAARNAEYVYYATPNLAAREHLSQEYFENAIIHPDATVLARSEVYKDLPPRVQKTLNSVFNNLVR